MMPIPDSNQRNERGFTLLEIIIAISILVLIMGVAYASLQGIIRTKELVDDRREAHLVASSVLRRLTRELQLAFSGNKLLPPEDNDKEVIPMKLCLLGKPGKLDNGEPGDSITFLALEGGQYLPDGGTHSGVVQITYEAKDPPEPPPSGEEKTFYLVRQEVPYTQPIKSAYEKEMVFPITQNLVSLQFRYYNIEHGEWYESWGSGEQMGLPDLVKFTIQLRSPSGRIESFTTTVPTRNTE